MLRSKPQRWIPRIAVWVSTAEKIYKIVSGETWNSSQNQVRKPKGPFRTIFSTESDSVVFYYSVVNLLRIVIHYWKYSKSVPNVVIQYIFSSESLRVVNSLRIVNSLRVLFLVCWGPLGKEPKPKLLTPDIFGWDGGLPHEGVGPKSSICLWKPREIKLFWRDIPGFCRDIPAVPEKFEKKWSVFNFRPLQMFRGSQRQLCIKTWPLGLTLRKDMFLPSKLLSTPRTLPYQKYYGHSDSLRW